MMQRVQPHELTHLPAPSDGFAYGTQSSGAQDLALALLLLTDCLGETPLPDTPEQETLLSDRYRAGEELAREVIARLDPEIPWSITERFLQRLAFTGA